MSSKYLQQVERCLTNVLRHPELNAFVATRDPVDILKDVTATVGRATSSPLQGKLIAIKDNICTTDLPTTCASNILSGHVSPFAATVVTKLQAAGAVISGKTNMDEFGMGSHSRFSNSKRVLSNIDPELSAGGSSGGSAVAVATNQCHAALGTDTGGSVRLPAAYTGIIGFKPSYGLVSRWGVVPYANSLDTVGILAREVGTVKAVFDAIKGYDHHDPTSLSEEARLRINDVLVESSPVRKFRIGIPPEFNVEELDPVIRKAWLRALLLLQKQGHSIHQVSVPATKLALPAYYVLAPAEASSNLAKYDGVRYGRSSPIPRGASDVLYANTRGEGFGAEVKRRILLGAYSLSATAIDNYFLQAQRVRRMVQDDFNKIFRMPHPLLSGSKEGVQEGVDVVLSPASQSTPPAIRDLDRKSAVDVYSDDVLTVPASLAGLPAITIPFHSIKGIKDEEQQNRLPIGLQITGQYGNDDMVLEVAETMTAT